MGRRDWNGSNREPPAEPVAPEPTRVLERHRATAESALQAATCGRPMCRIGDGPDVGRPKYAEGALAALTELQRNLGASTTTDAAAAARDLLETWERERHLSEGRGRAWVAYRNGGVAQLRGVIADLTGAADS